MIATNVQQRPRMLRGEDTEVTTLGSEREPSATRYFPMDPAKIFEKRSPPSLTISEICNIGSDFLPKLCRCVIRSVLAQYSDII